MLTKDQTEYLATLSTTKVVHMQPWTPSLKEIAEELISQVHAFHPEIEARFSGAAALGIAGQNDIDLDFMTSPVNFDTYFTTFKELFGSPRDTVPSTAVWTFYREGIEIDMWLSDPNSETSQQQWKVFTLLRDTPSLCKEYEGLKLGSEGKSYQEYTTLKFEFFDRLLNT